MNKFTYDDKRANGISFPLGGIGTGCLRLSENGILTSLEANNYEKKLNDAFSFFAVKAVDDNSAVDARIITVRDETDKNSSFNSELYSYRHFEKCSFTSFFPFAEINFTDSTFPAEIKMTGFNPFIPLNYTDSGIPAAFFEFEITNTSEEKKDFTICAVIENPFENKKNSVGCTENGEAYLHMTGSSPKNGVCISTDGKNVSYCEKLLNKNGTKAFSDFWDSFTNYPTFADKNTVFQPNEGGEGALEVRFFLNKGEKITVRFLISWYFSRIDDFFDTKIREKSEKSHSVDTFGEKRNYYAQYLENSVECASYCFKHWNRLKSETLKFSECLLGSTLPPDVLSAISHSLCVLKSKVFVRTGNGLLFDLSEKLTSASFALFYLFPELDKASVSRRIKYFAEILDDTTTLTESKEEISVLIIKFFGYFRLYGNEDELIEGWYDVSRLIDGIFSANDDSENTKTGIRHSADFFNGPALAVLKSVAETAEIVKDKKRSKAYSDLYNEALKLLGLSNNCDDAFYRRQLLVQSFTEKLGLNAAWSYENISHAVGLLRLEDSSLGFTEASLMLEYGRVNDGLTLIQKICRQEFTVPEKSPFAYDLSSYCLLSSLSGFKYNAYEKHIEFSPLSDYCPTEYGDTFKCFFCVENGYGYVEEGIDYIEINMLYGRLDIKSFSVPRTPRIVQYCGRNRRFTCSELCVKLDTNLEVSSDKKLTILIDIKPQG